MKFDLSTKKIGIALTTFGLLGGTACSATEGTEVDAAVVGSVSEALTCSTPTYYLKNKSNSRYCRIDPGTATTRPGAIRCDQTTTASAMRVIKQAVGTGLFKFQIATGAYAGFYVHKPTTRLGGNGTFPITFRESACSGGFVAYKDQNATGNTNVKMEGDTQLSTTSANSCGTPANEFLWEAAGTLTDCPAAGTLSGSTNPSAPATYFNLSNWKITLPVDKFNEGKAAELTETELPNWFDTNFFVASNGNMIFKVPNTGVTTESTSNTRSELRGMLRAGNTAIGDKDPLNNFVLSSHPNKSQFAAVGQKLSATLAVNHVSAPTSPGQPTCDVTKKSAHSVIVGQVHTVDASTLGSTWSINNEPLRIYYKKHPTHPKGSVFWTYSLNVDTSSDFCTAVWGNCWTTMTDPGAAGVDLGEAWSYVVDIVGTTMNLTFTRANGPTRTFSVNLATGQYPGDNPEGYAKNSFYFKLGAYNQSNAGTNACPGASQTTAWQYANGAYAQVTFSAATHGPSGTASAPTCTDGIKNGTETNTDCGGVSGGVTCPACPSAVCGNGSVQSPEQCDDGNTTTETCPTYGGSCTNVCSASCQFVTVLGPRCGDSSVQGGNGEQCDDGNTTNTDGCSNTCKTPTCTDGIKNGTETNTDCGGVSGGFACPACPTGGATYQAEANGMVRNECDAPASGWVNMWDSTASYIQKDGSVAGRTVTIRYRNENEESAPGSLSLRVAGELKETKVANATDGAELTFNYAVLQGQSVRISNAGASEGMAIDYIRINP
ncbi:MAG: polysaccharide lyase family 7 protein [Polyangiaceae bacterium]|nr:polysaccharide lyase family 7 protein [Polyangiaceae bacterium]